MSRSPLKSLALLPLLFTLSLPLQAAQKLESIVAVVDDDVILKSELDETLVGARKILAARHMQLPSPEVLQQQVLASLVIKRIQLAQASRMNLAIDDNLLNQQMEQFARQNGLKGLPELRAQKQSEGLAWEAFREQFREELLISQLQQRMVGPQVNVSEQEVDHYLSSMQSQGQVNIEYHWSHILLSTPQAATSAQIEKVRLQAEQLHGELLAGADFAQAAVSQSKDRNALQGGDMGWSSAGQLPSLFSTVVPALKPGAISQVLRSPSGFHIVTLLAVRNTGVQGQRMDTEQLRGRVRNLLQERKFKEQLEQWLLQIRDAAYVEIRL